MKLHPYVHEHSPSKTMEVQHSIKQFSFTLDKGGWQSSDINSKTFGSKEWFSHTAFFYGTKPSSF